MGIVLLFPLFSFAYSDKTTHPALTNEIVTFFNLHYSDLKLNDKERKLIVDGSVEEDAFGRWMQHYYDPIYNRGLVLLKKWQSSKEWAQDAKAQAGIVDSAFAGSLKAYFSGEDDYSWERAIYEYTWGDKERGLSALGHILHLIEDATVPPHTRNDPHLVYLNEVFHDRSPYEHWTSKFDIENIDVVKDLKYKNPIELSSLNEYFDTVTSYTNKNFFSKDTIFDKEYSEPNVDFYTIEKLSNNLTTSFGYRTMNNDSYKIVRIDKEFDWKKLVEDNSDGKYFIIDDDDLILSDYWSILSKQAVLNGAGVVKLFFDKVEEERETKILAKKNRSWFQRVYDATVGNIFDATGAIYGSSVTYEDLQSAVIQSQNVEPISRAPLGIEAVEVPEFDKTPTRVALVEEGSEIYEIEEIVEDVVIDSLTNTYESENQDENEEPDFYNPKLIPINTPFFGGGGGGVKTEPIIEEVLILSLSESSTTTSTTASTTTSTSATTTPTADITPPATPTLTVIECSNSLSSSICLLTSTTVNLSYNSTSTDISYYSILKDNTQIATTTATSSLQMLSNGSYSIAVVAYDEAGNTSATSTKEIEIMASPVVINEVAWAGTATSSSDEWIELYNASSKDIDLSKWVFMAEDGAPYIPLSGTISAGEYYLIERTDDNTVSDIPADLIAPFSGIGGSSGLGNRGEHLFLVYVDQNATSTIDEVPRCGLHLKWCGGLNSGFNVSKHTMERYDPYVSGTEQGNWGTTIGEFILNGEDAGGLPILGTPKAKNSISHQIANGTMLFTDKTLKQKDSPYLIGRDGFTVAEGATLTLEAGTVIKLVNPNKPSLIVNGNLIAGGTSEKPVVITSFVDDEYGGDMNGDGLCEPNNASSTAACPMPGNWRRLLISNSSSNSSFNNTIIRYGGRWFNGIDDRAMVVVDSTAVDFQNSTIEYAKKRGLYLKNSDSAIRNSVFRNNNTDYDAVGLLISAGAPSVTDSSFENNNQGMSVGSAPQFRATGNTFTDNNDEAIVSTGAIGTFQSNSGSGNGLNAIVINGYLTGSDNSTTTLLSNQLPYVVIYDASIIASSTLAFAEGVVIKGHNNTANKTGRIIVKNGGKLFSDGTDSNDLVFTSIHDDSVGGAVDSATTSPSAGDWYGIKVESGGVLNLSGFTLRYAGGLSNYSGNDKGGIKITGNTATSTIANALFDNNYQYGIRLENDANLAVSNTTFKNHTEQKIGSSTAVWLFDSDIELQDIIFENNDLDINALGASTVMCINCGAPTTDPTDLLP